MSNFFNQNNLFDTDENGATIMPIFTEIEGNPDLDCSKVPLTGLPILPLRNMVMYPGVALPVSVGRSKSMQLIKDAYPAKQFIGVICQKEMNINDPDANDLYSVGTIAEIVKILEMPDGTTTVILQGKKRFRLDRITSNDPYMHGDITILEEEMPVPDDKEFEALTSSIKDLTFSILKIMGEPTRELIFALRNIENAPYLINFLCSNIPVSAQQKQEFLETGNLKQRAYYLYSALNKEAQLIKIKAYIYRAATNNHAAAINSITGSGGGQAVNKDG